MSLPAVLRILVVEDRESDFLLLCRHLRGLGVTAEFRRAAGAPEVRAALADGPWQIMLADYHLPGFDFRTLLREWRAGWPALPVILVTGTIGEEQAVDLLREGVADVVLKDHLPRLLPAIERCLAAQAERRAAEAAQQSLADQQAWTQALLAALADGVFVAQDERFVFANPALVDMLDWSSGDIVGLPFDQVLSPAALPVWTERFRQHMRAPAEAASGSRLEVQVQTRLQRSIWLELRISRFVFGGRPAVLGVVRDVTEQRRAAADLARHRDHLESLVEVRTRAAAEANRTKSAFLAHMSHEIRTPMNAIIGMTHLLKSEPLNSLATDRLRTIDHAAHHLLGIVNDILDLAKVESGKLTLEHIPFDLDALLARTCNLVAERARAKGLALVLANDAPGLMLRGDPTRLSQAVLNLLTNAIKFTDLGQVLLRCVAMPPDMARLPAGGPADGLRLHLEVVDTGIGIAPERQSAIFTAYEQAEAATSRLHGGTGLGLAITRQVVRLMGGEVGVASAPGEGSRFGFTVVLERDREAPAPTAPPLAGVPVLLLEPLPEARQAAARALRHLGAEVESATDTAELLAAVRAACGAHRPPALILLGLPDAEAEPALQALGAPLLQALDGAAAKLVWLASRDGADLPTHALAAGFDAVLLKPLSATLLAERLPALLRGATRLEPTSHDSLEATLRRAHAGSRVLLAEDNPVNQAVALALLRGVGLVVDVANDGAEAVSLAQAGHHSLVLMDVEMPVLDGLHATRALRALPGLRALPVIAMTANASPDDRTLCLSVGMDDFLAKPVEPNLLYRTLLRWLPRLHPA